MKYFSFLLIFLAIINNSLAEVVSIPLNYTGHPAKDLIGPDGKPLSTIQAKIYWAQHEDLSGLNPKENDVWKNTIGRKLSEKEDDFKLRKGEVYKYVDKVVASVGTFRFVMREESQGSEKRNFNVWVRKDSRSLLLRKNLLRKLGYEVPKFQHVQEIKVKFNGLASLNAFVDELEIGTFADVDRWRIDTDEDKFVITLQDVVVFQTTTEIYDLAEGQIGAENIAHRRVLNSLVLPYALVDVRESVDGLPWSLGKIDNKVVLFDIISGDAFTTTYDDAVWMVKRMAKLKPQDLEEIVRLSYFPDSVGSLLTQKLISRLNSLKKIFLKNPNLDSVNYEISDTKGELIRGRLKKDNWDGHASRYSFDDTESPLSKDEMVAYFKSKFYSGVIENLVSYVNNNYLYETDIQAAAIEKAIEAQRKQFEDFFETGEFKKIPFSAWVIPTARGHISASRDIVTGAYLGTDNLIQIADSLEFIGEVGAFVGTLGLPVEQTLYATGSARFSRSYTHVKSIKSIKRALKEPFRNILIPRLKRQKAGTIVQMIDSLKSEDFAKLEGDERTAEVEKIFKEFENVLEVGDSVIISNNIILGGSLVGGYTIPIEPIDINALVQVNARKVNLWRLHITRTGDRTFQVYKSRASSLGGGFGFEVDAFIPIVSVNFDHQKGYIRTNFHSLNFDSQEDTDGMIRKLVELRQVLVENSTELMTKSQKPFIVEHNFKESSTTARTLTENAMSVKLLDRLKITHPEDFTTEFYVRSISRLKGKNYIQVAYDLVNAIIEEVYEVEDVSLSNVESGNPGDSFYGRSFSRVATTEIPFNDEDSEIPFEVYAHVQSQWKGWAADRGTLTEIKNEVQEKYGRDIFNDELFYDTDKIKLYTVDVNLSVYQSGIETLTDYNHEKLMNIVNEELVLPWPKGKSKFIRRGGRRFNKYRRDRSRIIQAIASAHRDLQSEYKQLLSPEVKSKQLTIIVDSLEAMMPFDTFMHLVGGDENFYLKGVVNGFRVGTENGEEPIISHALGAFGSEFTGGIADTLRNAIKISRGELGAFWFLRRVQ